VKPDLIEALAQALASAVVKAIQEEDQRAAQAPIMPTATPASSAFEALPEYCTPQQVGAYLQLGRNTTYDLIKRGVVPSRRFGKLIRVPKSALSELLRNEQK
jgi:excisionase family DNA binding protein